MKESNFIRLDKLLARQGFGTRSSVKKLIRNGSVQVNGAVCTRSDTDVNPDADCITADGCQITYKPHLYLMVNKPQNTVCAAKDTLYTTVFDLLDEKLCRRFLGGNLHIAGRLDADTEGLLICTTDGELTHRIISPKRHIAKTYFVGLKEKPADPDFYVQAFKKGIAVPAEGREKAFTAQSAVLEWLDDKKPPACCYCTLTVYEGKYHQVKRMFAAAGNEVVFLRRTAIGTLTLNASLKPGEYRELTAEELSRLTELTE